MELKTIVIILSIILAVSLFYNLYQHNEIEEYQDLTEESINLVYEWCDYSNELITFINDVYYSREPLSYNNCYNHNGK